jgi:outer membrane protein assembly factor BamB
MLPPRLVPVLLLLGCTPTERPASVAAPAVAAPDEITPEAESPAPRPASEAPAWHWASTGPVDGDPPWPAERVCVALPEGEVQVHGDGSAAMRVESTDPNARWTATIDSERSNAAAVAVTDDAIFVAHFHAIATGARVAKLRRDDGRQDWDVPLFGVGSIGHSRYRNDVQVEVLDGRLHVYGWESGGAYVEVLDLETGRQLHHAPVDLARAGLPWSWHGDPDAWHRTPTTFALGDDVVLPFAEGEFSTGAAVTYEGVVFLAHGSAIATGATLYAIDPGDGTIRWQRRLRGAGPVAHSEYFNALQVGVEGDAIVVYGNESAGRYLEVVGPDTGRVLASKLWTGR